MFQSIKKSNSLNRLLRIDGLSPPETIHSADNKNKMNPLLASIVLLGSVGLAHFFIPSFVAKIVLLSFVGIALSNLIKNWNFQFVLKLGEILILIVMAVLGLKLKFSLIQFDARFMGFLVVCLLSNFVVMLGVAKLLNVNTAWVPIASMANVGGIATAPAVTAAYEKKWMPHAAALVHDPQLLILDEPTKGLDPNQLVSIRKLIRELGKNKTVLLSTHILQEVDALCDRVIIINKGKIVLDQALDQLRSKQEQIIEVSFDYCIEIVALEKLPNVQKVINTHDFDYELHLKGSKDLRPTVFDFAHDNGLKILNLQLKNESLEQLFKKLKD